MTKPTVVPINKRFPGQHAARIKVWFPTHWSLDFEGRLPAELAEFVVAALVHGIDDAMRQGLAAMTRRLKQKRATDKGTRS